MGVSNTTTLNDLVGSIVAQQAQSAAYQARVMRNIISAYEVIPGAGNITIPRFQSITVAGLTEATAPTPADCATDGVTLTPVERGALLRISKTVLHADPWTDLAPYGEQLGRALAQDEDNLILDAVSFSTIVNQQGDGANNVAVGDLLSAIGALEAANAPGPYVAVWHPVSWSKIRAGIDDASVFASVGKTVVEGFAEGFTNMAGFVGSPYGVPCFISTGVNAVSDDVNSYANLVMSKQAVGYAYMQDIGVDVDDNIAARAMDLMGWYSGDADELVDAYGIQVEDDIDG